MMRKQITTILCVIALVLVACNPVISTQTIQPLTPSAVQSTATVKTSPLEPTQTEFKILQASRTQQSTIEKIAESTQTLAATRTATATPEPHKTLPPMDSPDPNQSNIALIAHDSHQSGFNNPNQIWQINSQTLFFDYTDDTSASPGSYSFHITSKPTNGRIIGGGRSYTYYPNPGFTGIETITWYLHNGEVDSNIATITINIESTSPPPGSTYYLSSDGNDSNNGLTESSPIATFDHAWDILDPGDTLVIMDGTYYQSLNPTTGGIPGNPLTIRAQNDGQVVIDGQFTRDPIVLWKYNGAEYIIIEGLVAKNGNTQVPQGANRTPGNGDTIKITSNHNILRRVSAYNANTYENSSVIRVSGGNNLIEDSVAAGSGRKMILVYTKQTGNVVRRSFAQPREWDGRRFCSIPYPFSAGIEIYDGSFHTIENSIGFGFAANYLIGMKQQVSSAEASYNQLMGNMAIYAGRNLDGSPTFDPWPTERPGNPGCGRISMQNGVTMLSGLWMTGPGTMIGNIWQDNFAFGNGQAGFMGNASGPKIDNQFISNTLHNNGIYNAFHRSGNVPSDTTQWYLDNFKIVEDNDIGIVVLGEPHTGEGAKLTHQYIDGELTKNYLWPWPMEERIKAEFGVHLKPEHQIQNFSITCELGRLINAYTNNPITNINVEDYCSDTDVQ